jgi:antibiotic biosynthesis monooxygenase (ABM) superfamily enzyme
VPDRTPQSNQRSAPPRYKLALITWLGAYGVITLILAVLGPAMEGWPLAARTLLISGLMVSALTWVVVPPLARLFRPWLAPAAPPARPAECRARARTSAGAGSLRRSPAN